MSSIRTSLMRPPAAATLLAVLAGASACAPEPEGVLETQELAATSAAVTKGNRKEGGQLPPPPGATVARNPNRAVLAGRAGVFGYPDWSGELNVKIWTCSTFSDREAVVQCSVDPDYVLVGGGAWASYNGPGVLLTASYPVDPAQLTTWEARSKPHGVADSHVLYSFAIGLKLVGYQRGTLLSNMYVNQTTSAPSDIPEAIAPGFDPSTIITLSGGCLDDWHGAGNLLTVVWSDSCRGKAHVWSDPSAITHYAIGVNRTIPGFGELESDFNATTVSGAGPLQARVRLLDGFVPISPRAFSSSFPWTGPNPDANPGRLLTRIGLALENSLEFVSESKDHFLVDEGRLDFGLIMLRKRP